LTKLRDSSHHRLMTIETINTVEPKDITAIEFACKACGAKTVRKIDDRLTVPIKCGNCSDTWLIADGAEVQALREFIKQLESYGKNGSRSKYVLRFQVPNGEND
jgi:hypothetical protein